jgi:putative membrane protein
MNKRTVFVAACLIPLLTACQGGFNCGPGGRWGNMMPHGYGGGMFMWMLLIIILGVLVVYWAARSAKSKGPMDTSVESPIDILKKRYAKGEVTSDEYEKMKKDLES